MAAISNLSRNDIEYCFQDSVNEEIGKSYLLHPSLTDSPRKGTAMKHLFLGTGLRPVP